MREAQKVKWSSSRIRCPQQPASGGERKGQCQSRKGRGGARASPLPATLPGTLPSAAQQLTGRLPGCPLPRLSFWGQWPRKPEPPRLPACWESDPVPRSWAWGEWAATSDSGCPSTNMLKGPDFQRVSAHYFLNPSFLRCFKLSTQKSLVAEKSQT